MTESSVTPVSNKKKAIMLGVLSLTVAAGCGFLLQHAFNAMGERPNQFEDRRDETFEQQAGKSVTLQGMARQDRIGATLNIPNHQLLYLDNVAQWPAGFHNKTVVVSGVLVTRHDYPVFIPQKGQPLKREGIAVPPGTDLQKASLRYVLEKPTYSLANATEKK